MSEQKHTPGPWEMTAFTTGFDINSEEFGLVCTIDGRIERDEANARLIAAAPDLYEACMAAMDELAAVRDCFCAYLSAENIQKHGSRCGPCLMRAAIAKAEGREQPQ